MAPRPSTPNAGRYLTSGSLPSPETIALALAVVKATPMGMSSRDYVIQLRAQLKRGRPAFDKIEQGRYLDLVAYWQHKCDTAEQRCGELEKRVASLERSVHCLGQLSQDAPEDTVGDFNVLPTTSSKKKGPTTTAPKRSKRLKAQAAKPPTPEETLEEDLQLFETLGNHGMTVAQHYWTTQTLLRRNDPDTDAICGSVVSTASALSQIFPIIAKNHDRLAIRTIHQPSLSHLGKDRSELSCLISACARTWTLIVVALDKLEQDTPGSRHSRMIIFECVKLFSSALDAIRLASRQAAWKQSTTSHSNPAPGSIQESIGARNIAHLLATFIGHLEKDSAIHHSLFEGIAYVLLERVGAQLYHCTFGHARGATIEDRIAPPPPPSDPHEIARKATDDAALRLEVKALIIILERVMGVAPLHANEQAQASKKGKTTLARTVSLKNVASTKVKLSALAQERLQRTLVVCTFGQEVRDDFMDVLMRPVDVGRVPAGPKIKDEEVFEWYQGQVWRLVGWEILGKEGEWVN